MDNAAINRVLKGRRDLNALYTPIRARTPEGVLIGLGRILGHEITASVLVVLYEARTGRLKTYSHAQVKKRLGL